MKVLVVDDDRVQLTAVRAWLESDGFTVITHDSPFGTGRLVTRERPDILLLDVSMPGLSGNQLADVLRGNEQAQAAGIILYSSYPRSQLDTLAYDHGLLGAIPKTETGRAFLVEFRCLVERWIQKEQSRKPRAM